MFPEYGLPQRGVTQHSRCEKKLKTEID